MPTTASAGESFSFSAGTTDDSVPAISYHWDFGEGTTDDSARVQHTYTRAGNFQVRLTVEGIDDLPAVQTFEVKVMGNLKSTPTLANNRRFTEPTDAARRSTPVSPAFAAPR